MQFTVQISMSNHLQAKVMLLGAPTNSSSGSFSGLHEPISSDMGSLAVLVVDDDADSRAILRTWFELWGLKVREAAHAAEAIEQMFEQPADIVFLDIMMPGRDGLWLAERIHLRWPHTAI